MPLPQSRTLGGLLDEMAARHPERPALIFQGTRVTYRQFQQEVGAFARGLLHLGVRRGTHVALLMGNRLEWLYSAFAVIKLGATLIGLNTWYRPRELAYVLERSEATVLITAARFLRHDYGMMLRELIPELERSRPGALASERFPHLRMVVIYGLEDCTGAYTWDQVRGLACDVSESRLAELQKPVSPEDIAYILYTSGTGAAPKGVTLRHRSLIENAFSIGERQHLTEHDKLWIAAPLFWIYASGNALLAIMTHGGCFVLQEVFDPAEALQLIEAERCTVFYGMPNMARAMAEHPDRPHRDLCSLRTGITIGSPEDLRVMIDDLGITNLCNVYGLSEAYGNSTVTDADDPVEIRLHTQGKPLPGQYLRIVDPDTGAPLATGAVGEICITGHITPGYFKNDELNRAVFDGEGFLHTGDLGYLDAEGRLHFRARLREMIKTGGINVAPLEVEEVLLTHPKVKQAYVLGIPDIMKGEEILAVLELHEGAVCTAEELQTFCRQQMASYKVPRHIQFRNSSELPHTETGKVLKRALREQAIQQLIPQPLAVSHEDQQEWTPANSQALPQKTGDPKTGAPDIGAVIQNMVHKLIDEYSPQKVILFGSHAYGTPGPDSDIDLLIIKKTSTRFIDRWVVVQRILTGTHRALPVETLVLTPREVEKRLANGDQFIAEILEKGKVLYGA
jgi:fatty-acyl-CoA synthase